MPWTFIDIQKKRSGFPKIQLFQGRIQVWANPAPAPSFDSQIMQLQLFFGLYQPLGPLFLQILHPPLCLQVCVCELCMDMYIAP